MVQAAAVTTIGTTARAARPANAGVGIGTEAAAEISASEVPSAIGAEGAAAGADRTTTEVRHLNNRIAEITSGAVIDEEVVAAVVGAATMVNTIRRCNIHTRITA